jgi:predicted phosphodiesterase
MYNYKTDKNKLIDIAIKYAHSKSRKVSWLEASKELNKLFDESISKDAWKKRYNRAMEYLMIDVGDEKLGQRDILVKKPITEKEITDTLITYLKGGSRSVQELASRAKLTLPETIGYLTMIETNGMYRFKKSNDFGGQMRYAIDTALNQERVEYDHSVGSTTTYQFMVLSDSHMGSTNEQTSFLHYLYDLAQSRGITTVYHCGDISEGFKRSRPAHIFSLHAISFDEQLEHIVKAYPKRDNITTYFITGNHDHFHIENGGANIGKGIQANRSDMKYLGINTAVIKLGENCKMELFHPQDGSSYATSYAGQKYLDSLSGGDKPNILFVGHHHKSLYFLYRNVHYFEVPSTHSQSDWEKGKRIQNTSGAWIITVDVDSEGTVTRIAPESIIQFKHIKNDWKQWKELKR